MAYVAIVILTAIALFMLIVALTMLNRNNKGLTVAILIIISVGGLFFYGMGYTSCAVAQIQEGAPAGAGLLMLNAAFDTIISTVKMFSGFRDESVIAGFPPVAVLIFRLIHFLALAVTARAILTVFGSGMMARLKELLNRKGELAVIFGVNESSLRFGEELHKDGRYSVVFVGGSTGEGFASRVLERTGGILYSESWALDPDDEFFKRTGISKKGHRTIVVYTLHEDENKNVAFASKFGIMLNKLEIPKERVSLTLLANMELNYGSFFQAKPGNELYGYGSVMVTERSYLIARALTDHYPPCDFVKFDTAKAVAKSDFHAVIAGFGKLGQFVLRQLVINGQFEGSNMKIYVFDPDLERKRGNIGFLSAPMLENYDIEFFDDAVGSESFVEKIEKDRSISYFAVCMGDPIKNSACASIIQTVVHRINTEAAVLQCTLEGISYNRYKKGSVDEWPVFTRDSLDIILADKAAMALNYIYCRSNKDEDPGKAAVDHWVNAGYLDKMSSRASAEFTGAYLRMSGKSEEEILASENFDINGEQLENMAKTEHLRWCAFHYSFGYTPMPPEVFEENGKQYKREIKKKGTSSVIIQKDYTKRYHACLIPWDELDELSEKYTAYTGKKKNYKQDDRNNVLQLPELLKVRKEI